MKAIAEARMEVSVRLGASKTVQVLSVRWAFQGARTMLRDLAAPDGERVDSEIFWVASGRAITRAELFTSIREATCRSSA